MGAGASVESLSAEEIGKGVASLGKAYEAYNQTVVDEGISGKVLFKSVHEDENLFRAFVTDTLGVNKPHHQTAMYTRYVELMVAGEGDKDGSSADPLDALVALAKTIVVKDIKINDGDLYHCFLSYRQKTEKTFSTVLFSGVKALAVDEEFAYADCKPKLFLDTKSLRDGEDWEVGFVRGLLSSQMMVPLVSWHERDEGSVAQMIGFSEVNDYQDNVLLEWELALALLEWDKSMLKAIFPVLIADKDSRGFLDFPFHHFNKLSTLPSLKTKQKLVAICLANGIPLPEKAVRRSVKEVVAEITQNQGVKMSELGAENIAMSNCEKRVFDKAAELARLALGEHGIGKISAPVATIDPAAAAINAATAEITAMKAKAEQEAKEIKAKAEREAKQQADHLNATLSEITAMKAKAEQEIAEMKAKAEKEGIQQAPAKATVRIAGLTGPLDDSINGMYEFKTEEVYAKVGDPLIKLQYRAHSKKWLVTSGEGGINACVAECTVPAKCLPQDCPAGLWYLEVDKNLVIQPAVTISVATQQEAVAYLAEAARVLKGSHNVRIAGATGEDACTVNGMYEPTTDLSGDMPVYAKVGSSHVWLVYRPSRIWEVRCNWNIQTYVRWAYCDVPAKCLPQDCPTGQWNAWHGSKLALQPAVTISVV